VSDLADLPLVLCRSQPGNLAPSRVGAAPESERHRAASEGAGDESRIPQDESAVCRAAPAPTVGRYRTVPGEGTDMTGTSALLLAADSWGGVASMITLAESAHHIVRALRMGLAKA
jgi:hypothetical protein